MAGKPFVLYDNTKKTGGILHLMLPKCKNRNGRLSKYADTGIPLLIDLMVNKANANRRFLTAKIFGGAKMFSVNSDMFNIGKSNILETKIILEKMNIKIVAERTGGANGHQISLDTTTGIVQSRIFGQPTLKY